jgi:hypothetical protein
VGKIWGGWISSQKSNFLSDSLLYQHLVILDQLPEKLAEEGKTSGPFSDWEKR